LGLLKYRSWRWEKKAILIGVNLTKGSPELGDVSMVKTGINPSEKGLSEKFNILYEKFITEESEKGMKKIWKKLQVSFKTRHFKIDVK
jgi:hypothetical protein